MVTENLAVANKLDFDPDADFANSANIVNDALDGDELGGFSSIDDLEEFLAKFTEGTEEEATLSTQGEGDVGGKPLDTVH